MNIETIELEILVKQLKLENEELKKLLRTYFQNENKERELAFNDIEYIEKNIEFEENFEVDPKVKRLNKRDRMILMGLSEKGGLDRDQICTLYLSEIKNAPITCNRIMNRLTKDGYIRVDRKTRPYTYYAKHSFVKPKTNGFVYVIKEFKTGSFKIGKAKNLEDRLKLFNVKLPFDWEMICSFKSNDYSLLEKLLHEEFSSKRIEKSEWFELTDEDISALKENKFSDEIKKAIL